MKFCESRDKLFKCKILFMKIPPSQGAMSYMIQVVKIKLKIVPG